MFIKNEHSIKISIFILGFTCLITQIILLREFLSVFNGNELVIGIILANWMLLTGIGAYLGKFADKIKNKIKLIIPAQLLIGILPLITVFLLNYLRNIVFPPGKMISLIEIFFGSLILIAPFCIISGLLFTIFSSYLFSIFKSNVINKVYGIEALGSIAGGLLFNFVFLFLLKTFVSLEIILIINFAVVIILLLSNKKIIIASVLTLITIIISVVLFINDIDSISAGYLYKNQEIVYQKDTPYGYLTVTKTADQLNFFENGVSLFSTENTVSNEENVHYAMVQHPNPENVLLISGGISGTINEILKYNIKSLDYVEINPWLIEIGKKLTDNIIKDKKVNIINQDARLFIRKSNIKYDVVLINLPNPANAQINRYYTTEFFKELKKVLNKDAVISISLMSTSHYMSEEAAQIHSVLFSTLKKGFKNVIIIPGGRNYFIASDNRLSYKITQLIELKNIENEYVNLYYLNDALVSDRSKLIEDALIIDVDINKDFKPLAYFLQLKYWLSYFKQNLLIIGLILLVPLFYLILRLNIVNLGLFTTGFSASSIEVLLLFAFQVIYGYVYLMIGVIITVFMIGLALGSIYLYKKVRINLKSYYQMQYLIGLYSFVLPVILLILNSFLKNNFSVHLIFLILIFSIGILTGIQFALASKLRTINISVIAATAYGSDLLGSAVGALLVSALLVPYFGIIKVSLIIGLLNIITGVLIMLKTKKVISG
ncbi:MAG: fused MFS/spermidine synthase [Bacteroidales bacterium]|nr:fused MFS/spermidine synthase [Bacteroidales bacterium]